MKRAMRNPAYAGFEAGVVVMLENGLMDNRVGSIVLDGEKLVGGWAKIHVKGWEVPMMLTVAFDEYVGRKSNGEVNQRWRTKPASMIRKVAIVQALREAFPEDLGGMYTAEERAVADLPETIVNPDALEAETELIEPPMQDNPVEEAKPVRQNTIQTDSKKSSARDALFGK